MISNHVVSQMQRRESQIHDSQLAAFAVSTKRTYKPKIRSRHVHCHAFVWHCTAHQLDQTLTRLHLSVYVVSYLHCLHVLQTNSFSFDSNCHRVGLCCRFAGWGDQPYESGGPRDTPLQQPQPHTRPKWLNPKVQQSTPIPPSSSSVCCVTSGKVFSSVITIRVYIEHVYMDRA